MTVWKFSERAKRLMGKGKIGRTGPLGIRWKVLYVAEDEVEVQLEVVDKKGRMLSSLEPLFIQEGCSLTLSDIAPAFAYKVT